MKKTLVGLAVFGTVATTFAAEPLVSAEWLADNPDAVVLDIRTIDAYLNGHVPGAVSTPYAEGWRATMNDVPGQLPHVAVMEQKIAQLGVDADEHVVIVTDGKSAGDYAPAARVYWTLKTLGHEEVSLLDGGFAGWSAANLEVANDLVEAEKGDFTANFNDAFLVDAATLASDLDQWQTVDARPKSYFDGEEKFTAARVAGTVPGSVNLLHASAFTSGDVVYFADVAKLKEVASSAGVDMSASQSATFCNTGHLGSTNWFVLSELLELPNTALFDGSMTEWTADEDRPVQTAKKGLGKIFGIFGG
ncbi:sulfurtransferase [Salinibius halmophilus]|uniref:sulfurtransferase n=1 Tax=Salinibius halmophilus TaxID=1853216 RepID=UPI001314C96F|nr:rhodanese-like domain-containing protein [Salinibius halmophilus]